MKQLGWEECMLFTCLTLSVYISHWERPLQKKHTNISHTCTQKLRLRESSIGSYRSYTINQDIVTVNIYTMRNGN